MNFSVVFNYFWMNFLFFHISGNVKLLKWILCNPFNEETPQDAVVFKFSNLVCKSYNESWITFGNCRLKAVSRERILLNANATLLYPTNDIGLHIKLWKKANGFKPWLLESTIDCCRFMQKTYNPFANIVFNIYKDFSNFNHTCPYMVSFLFFL